MKFQNIAPDVKLGKDVKIFDFVNLYGCEIGDESKVGAFVEIQKGVKVGKRVKISSHTFICEGVTIGDRSFVGHHVVFINDKYPLSANSDGTLKKDADWKVIKTVIEEDVSLGSGAVILCGLKIGRGAMIGAGSVVTKNVPAKEVWAGNPAKFLRKV